MLRFIGLKAFTEKETNEIRELSELYSQKILRDLPKANIIIHTKKHETAGKVGKAVKYSLHARVEAPSILLSSEAADWDLKKVVHETLRKLETEMQHKFRTDAQYKREYER